jgi:putative hydrolase of the HAD superfamily
MLKVNFGTVFVVTLVSLFALGLFSTNMRPEKKIIVFDSGGFAEVRVNILKNLIAQKWGVLEEEAQEVLRKWHSSFQNESSDQQWWELYAASMGTTMSSDWIEQFSATWKDATAPIPGILTLVKSLQQQGYKVALLSDNAPLEQEIIKKMGYYDVFSRIIPRALLDDSKSYKPLFKELSISPSACLFVDDRQENITKARKAGMDAIFFISVSRLYEELEQRNIFVPCNSSETLFYID